MKEPLRNLLACAISVKITTQAVRSLSLAFWSVSRIICNHDRSSGPRPLN